MLFPYDQQYISLHTFGSMNLNDVSNRETTIYICDRQ